MILIFIYDKVRLAKLQAFNWN